MMATTLTSTVFYVLHIVIIPMIINAESGSNYSNVCVWGRRQLPWMEMNGIYRYVPNQLINGKPYYKMDTSKLLNGESSSCSHSIYYLYYYNQTDQTLNIPTPTGGYNGWYIAQLWGSQISSFNGGLSNIKAHCKNTAANLPSDCGNNWEFTQFPSFISWISYSSLIVSEGRCPSIDCSSIDITINNNGNISDTISNDACSTTISGQPLLQIGTNNYFANNKNFFFNHKAWDWICSSGTTSKYNGDCDNPIDQTAQTDWNQHFHDNYDFNTISISGSMDINMYIRSIRQYHTITLTCNGM